MRMQIVIPMAGEGRRFTNSGYKDLKPFIKVDGQPIVEYVVSMFPGESDFLFIFSNKNFSSKYVKIIKKIVPNAKIIHVPFHKKGPVQTLLAAKDYIKDDEPTIVNYCDFFMDWDYKGFKKLIKRKKTDGAIVCYKGFHPHLLRNQLYAGVKTDKKNIFIETREKYSYTKNSMDSWQSAGTYYFRTGEIVKKYLQQVKKEKLLTNGEYYVPWAFNLMKKDNLKTIVFPTEHFCQWGTPEDLEEYLYWSKYFNNES